MLKEIEQLLVIQNRDQKIRALRAELETIPFEQKRAEQFLTLKDKAFNGVKQRGREIEVQRKKLELDAQVRRDAIVKFKTQQFQTRKNEEFQAISHEIQRLESEIQSIEDQEIERMEQIERIQPEIATAEQELKVAKVQVEQEQADLQKKKVTLEERLRTTEQNRDELTTGIDSDLLYRYERLFVSKGGNAVVPVEHEFCMGCHMKNTSALVHRVKLNRNIVNCEQCGRILY
jgi:predicted  nucleic acid-binding Zn-ribbon protein